MNLKEKKENDRIKERKASQVILERFYRKICDGVLINSYDLERQYRGVDATLITHNEKIYVVDEKATLNNIGKKLETFALSINNFNAGGYFATGWFMDTDMLNDSYVFSWFDTEEDNTFALVKKSNIWNYLSSIGWDYDLIWAKSITIREAYEEYGEDYWKYCKLGNISENGMKFSYLPQYLEKDVNVLIPRNTLTSISDVSLRYNNGETTIIQSNFPIYL